LRQIIETSVRPTEQARRAASLRRSRNRWAQIAGGVSLVAVASIALAIMFWRPSSHGDAQFRQQALVTWPSVERGSAVSPDGRSVSFLSNRDGPNRLFVRSADGTGDASPVALPGGEIISHIWSSDGTRFLCAVGLPTGVSLVVIPAPAGGAPGQRLALGGLESLALLRWIGNSVYFQTDVKNAMALRRADLTQQTIAEVSSNWRFADARLQKATLRGFDVDPSGRRVVFAARIGEQTDLWTASINGTNPRRLTNDASSERLPMWTGTETVLYQSDRGGQVDLWESSVTEGWTRQRTTDWTHEEPDSASSDGTVMTFQQVSDNADLWLVNPGRPALQLTAEVTSDFSPTVSTDGRTLVFQRSKPASSGRFSETSTGLMKGTLDGGRISVDSVPIETDASVPLISPDGSRVAFLQESQPSPQLLKTLKIRNLRTGAVATVSNSCTLPVMGQFQWGALPMQWTPDGQSLLFLEQSDNRFRLKQHVVDSGKDNRLLVDIPRDDKNRMRGIFPTPDSRSVAYLRWSGDERYAVRQIDLESQQDSELARIDGVAGLPFQTVTIVGRTAQESLILLKLMRRLPAAALNTVEVLELKPDRQIRSITVVPNVVERIAHVDVARPLVYLMRANGLVQNMFSVSLENGDMRQLTDNQAPNVQFAGVTSLVDGSLLFVRNLNTRDIWLLRRPK
jgi:Tol biopolymer transport system component